MGGAGLRARPPPAVRRPRPPPRGHSWFIDGRPARPPSPTHTHIRPPRAHTALGRGGGHHARSRPPGALLTLHSQRASPRGEPPQPPPPHTRTHVRPASTSPQPSCHHTDQPGQPPPVFHAQRSPSLAQPSATLATHPTAPLTGERGWPLIWLARATSTQSPRARARMHARHGWVAPSAPHPTSLVGAGAAGRPPPGRPSPPSSHSSHS